LWEIKGKPTKYLKVRTVPKYNRTFVETETKLKSLKHITAPFHGLVHFFQGKFTASDLFCDRSVVFSEYSGFPTIKTDRHDVAEI
jgi:hypothetical protein